MNRYLIMGTDYCNIALDFVYLFPIRFLSFTGPNTDRVTCTNITVPICQVTTNILLGFRFKNHKKVLVDSLFVYTPIRLWD
jgi:hypothetical protein